MPKIIGYLRPYINGPNVKSQIEQLKAVGATKIIQELSEGAKSDRPQLCKLMADVRDGDTVVITSLDRIAHNTRHLLEVIDSFDASGVTFKVVDYGIDTSTQQGKIMRMLLGAINEFERKMVWERQAEGIDRAKREGRYKGRKPTARAKTDEVLALNSQGLTRQKIADELGIGVASVYRILKSQSTAQKKSKKTLEKPVDKQKRVERKPTLKHSAEQLSLF
jgi:DNA invertase Pin-like site-specific DNA recombinase